MKKPSKCAHRDLDSSLRCKAPGCGVVVDVREKQNKYGAKKVKIDGILFDSLREGQRYVVLKLKERVGEISELEARKKYLRYPLIVKGVHVTEYEADYRYKENGGLVIEDSKGVKTEVYKIKRALMKACLGIEVRET